MQVRVASLVLGAVLATALAGGVVGCASDGPPSPSPTPTTPRATFSGAATGYVVMNLCSSSGADSIIVRFDGSRTKYAGSITRTAMGFVGPDATPYVLDDGSKPPAASGDATRFTLDGVRLRDTAHPSRTITFAGTIVCP